MSKQLQVLFKLDMDSTQLENFMWLVGLMQDHGVITGGLRESVMHHYAKKLHHAVDRSVGLLQQTLRKRGFPAEVYHRCPLNESSCPHIQDTSFYVVVYNPLAWNVTLPVRLPTGSHDYTVFGPNDEEINTALLPIPPPVLDLTNSSHELVFLANVPAIGYAMYYIHKHTLETRRMRYKRTKVRGFKQTDDYEDDIETAPTITDDEEVSVRIEDTRRAGKIDLHGDRTVNISKARDEASEEKTLHAVHAVESKDDFIKNQYIQINLENGKISSIQLANGLNMSLDIQYYYYVSDDPHRVRGYVDPNNPQPTDRKSPGTYIFRTMDFVPVPIMGLTTTVYKSGAVQEIRTRYSEYASLVVRLYEAPVVEVDWLIGGVPVDDGLGKEVFIRYTTEVASGGVFYTDANGRQTVMRRRGTRGMYEAFNLDPIAGNIYPVTSRVYIEDLDQNMRFSIFNDRPQGATSLHDGSVDVMLQRRILTDDAGFQAHLNDTNTVRGTHRLYLTKANHKPNRIFEKKLAKEIELHPLVFVAQEKTTQNLNVQKEFTALKTKLPIGVHILTIQEWDNTMLLRLENYLEKIDAVKSGIKRVNIKDLFVDIKIIKIRETMLAGHIWLEDWKPLQWQLKTKFLRNFNDFYGNGTVEYSNDELKSVPKVNLDEGIQLTPQQIRTFVVWYEYINNV